MGRLLVRAGLVMVLIGAVYGVFHLTIHRTTEDRLATAQEYYGAGNYEDAIIELKDVLVEQPDHADAQWLVAQSYLGLRNGTEALLEIARLRELGRKGPAITAAELRAMLLDGQYEEVLSRLLFARGAAKDPSVFLIRGEARMGLRRFDSARDAFREALRIRPGNIDARHGLAAAALAAGETGEAETHIEAVLTVSPEDFEAWFLRGRSRLESDDAKGAAAAFAKALAAAGDAFEEILARAGASIAANDPAEAGAHLSEAVAIYPKSPAVHDLIELMTRKYDDLTAAETVLHKILGLAPDHPNTLLLMASVNYRRGDLKQAEANLSEYVGRRRGDRAATKFLARIYLTQGKPRVAIELLAPMVEMAPDDGELLTMLGGAYVKIKDYAKAVDILATAVDTTPDAAVANPPPGTIELMSGDANDGTDGLKDAIGMDIDYGHADRLLAVARFGRADYEAAVESAGALLKERPASPVPYNLLAAVREKQGDIENALRFYTKALALDSTNATALYNVARLNWKAGAVAGARQRFERVLSQERESIPVLLALSQIAIADDRLDDAVSLLQRARTADPKAVHAHLALADVYGRQGRLREALSVAEEAIGIADDDPAVLMALGRAQLAAERPSDALMTFRKLAELTPDSPDAHFQVAQACLQADHDTSARLALAKVLELDPRHLGAKVGLGTLALREGKTDKAMELAKEIQQTQPGLAAGHTLQGDLYMAQHKPADAVVSYQKALEQEPDTKLILKLVEAQRLAGDPRAADDTLNGWLGEHPDDVEARVVRAAAYLETGNTEAATKDYETALKLQPNHATALNELAWLYYRKGDPRALEMAEHAHSLLPDRPEVLDAYGWLLVENDHVARGMTLLKKALGKAPDDPQIRYHLVGALARDGQRQRAREELETLLRSDQDFLDRAAARRLLEDLR